MPDHFDPHRPLGPDIEVYDTALVVPFGTEMGRSDARPAGVFSNAGDYVGASKCLRTPLLKMTRRPRYPDPTEVANSKLLPGTWLWGGMLYPHFGHVLMESTSRFWGFDAFDAQFQGVIYIPERRRPDAETVLKPNAALLQGLMPAGAKIDVAYDLIRAERLVVPPQGFGLGDMAGGCPEQRQYLQDHLFPDVSASGPERLYISRSRLPGSVGRSLGEHRLEAYLSAEGYTVFHPQDHSLAEQAAHYKAASVIISSDNSALHLAAPLLRNDVKVGVILRRFGKQHQYFTKQLRVFLGRAPDVFSVMHPKVYGLANARSARSSRTFTILDFETLRQDLRRAGYVAATGAWRGPDDKEIMQELDQYQNETGSKISEMRL